MARDCYVRFRSEQEIARVAGDLRRRLNADPWTQFDIVGAINKLKGKRFSDSEIFDVEIFEGKRPIGKAYVTFNPLRMHLNKEVWSNAKIGDPYSRHILAHELGHIILHDSTAKAFSHKESHFGIFGFEEHSAEWQAEMFASYLLITDELIGCEDDIEAIGHQSGASVKYIQLRYQDFLRRKTKMQSSANAASETCLFCGNMSVVYQGINAHCTCCNWNQQF